MKKIFIIVLFLLMFSNPGGISAALNLNTATFSGGIELNSTYEWNIENYQVGDRIINTKSSPTSFEFVDGSDIELTVVEDPSGIDLAESETLSQVANLSDTFELVYDDLAHDFLRADPLYLWIFPTTGTNTNGESVNLITEFWIYNAYNLLRNGETLEFNSTLPEGTVSSSSDEGELSVTLKLATAEITARVDEATGLMNALNLVSDSPDFRIEIDRRGASGSALPTPLFWFIAPLLLLPIVYKIIKKDEIE